MECTKEGITLIEVPYWWDGNQSSLLATLYQVRPELVPSGEDIGDPIPLEPPKKLAYMKAYPCNNSLKIVRLLAV
jgi:hypothetical protein